MLGREEVCEVSIHLVCLLVLVFLLVFVFLLVLVFLLVCTVCPNSGPVLRLSPMMSRGCSEPCSVP